MIHLYTYMYLFFSCLVYYRILSGFLCYTVGPSWLFILCTIICIYYTQSIPPLQPSLQITINYEWVTIFFKNFYWSTVAL